MDRLIRRFNMWHLGLKTIPYNLVVIALLASFFVPLIVGALIGNGYLISLGVAIWIGVWMIGIARTIDEEKKPK